MQELQLHVEVALQQALEAAAMTGLILCHLVDGVVEADFSRTAPKRFMQHPNDGPLLPFSGKFDAVKFLN